MKDFIEIYDNALSNENCKIIIDEFENIEISEKYSADVNKLHKQNVERSFRNKKLKSSQDLTVSFLKQDYPINQIIMSCLLKHCKFYLNKNPQLRIFTNWGLNEIYNIQKYQPNQGYFGEHFENNHVQDHKRVMVWMIYLNTVTKDGGTYFSNYDKTINAVQGRLVIWPAYWTHTHRGVISTEEIKYIATGWFDTEAAFKFYPKFIS